MDFMAIISHGVFPTTQTDQERAEFVVSLGLFSGFPAFVETFVRRAWTNLKTRIKW